MLGAVGLSAAVEASRRWVTLTVEAEGMTSVSVFRVTPDGTQAVRGAIDKEVSSTYAVVADYEAPQNTALSYFARATDGVVTRDSPVVSPAGSVDRGGDVLFSLTNPLAWLRVQVVSFPEVVTRARRSLVDVVGRADPVAVSDVRALGAGAMTVATLTDSERQALNAMLAPGGIVAFSPERPTYGFGDVWYLSVGDATERRVVQAADEPSRLWTLPVQRVAPPPADFIGPAFRTWGEPVAESVTWGQWFTEGKTWLTAMVR